MLEAPGIPAEKLDPCSLQLRLVVTPEPWLHSFRQNFRDLFRSEPEVGSYKVLGTFWPDVFVRQRLPWRRFLESGLYHVFVVVFIWEFSQFIALQPHIVAPSVFRRADVIYYTPSEYLPPLDTRESAHSAPQKADPEIAKQPIISVPRESDNHSQTIVTPPKVHLPHDLPLPNTVAWSQKPEMPIAPAPVIPASQISRIAPRMQQAVITPPPAIREERDFISQKALSAPQASVVAPAPELSVEANRRFGDINIAPSLVIAPAPQLSVDQQRTADARRPVVTQASPQVIAPPPSVAASGSSRSAGDVIALSLHPAVGAPATPVTGNRRGTFAATPEGHAGATGNPGSTGAASGANGSGAGKTKTGDAPAGLYVGPNTNPSATIAGKQPTSPSANLVNPKLLANARPPRIETGASSGEMKISEAERAVFGGRRVYSLTLNMPNLNSAGGSWIIRFAALKQDSDGQPAFGDPPVNNLSSPVAMRKVDPAYPLELMRQNVAGTVILYGIIRADGTVSDVRVLRSVDDRLDHFASEAIAKWQFQPATKNGTAVDVEATFWIPFRPVRTRNDF
jgi:TonB family protein